MKTTTLEKNENQQAPTRPFISPEVSIYETKDAYYVEAEMPGVSKSGLELTLEGNSLTLIGRRQDHPVRGVAVQTESRPADFRRVFELDPAIDASRINARVEQGLLTVELHKAEAVKPRKIKVD